MKSARRATFLLTFCLLVSCTITQPGVPSPTLGTILPPTPDLVATAQPTNTLTLTSTLPLPTNTPSPTPAENVSRPCLDLRTTDLPTSAHGSVVLDNYNGMYFVNLDTGKQIALIPVFGGFVSISPNRGLLAIEDHGNQQLLLVNANNEILRSLKWQKDWALIYGWLDNEKLVIRSGGSTIYVFDYLTGKQTVYQPSQMPDLTDLIYHQMVSFDAGLDLVAYISDLYAMTLLSVNTNHVLAQADFISPPVTPIWNHDYSQVAFIGTPQTSQDYSEDIFMMSRDGTITQLTRLQEEHNEPITIWGWSWSPDNRSIAFWYGSKNGSVMKKAQLAILDVETHKTTDICTPAQGFLDVDFPATPVWSPDGQELLIERHYDNGKDDVILLVLNGNNATVIAENARPLGWMVNP